MFIDYLNKNENIKIVKAETNIMNSAMIKIFEYYCFERTIRYEENGIIWQCFEKSI